MILELHQPLPLDTPKGKAFAYFVIDYGTEHHLMWVCFIRETGECWTFRNPEVKLDSNATMGMRVIQSPHAQVLGAKAKG